MRTPKGAANTSTAMTEGERPSKRCRTTTGNYASTSTPNATVNVSGTPSRARAMILAQRRSGVGLTAPNTPMISTGKRNPLEAKPMEVYHEYATTYVPIDQEKTKWVELRCSVCGGNSSPSWKVPMKGCRGFQMHLLQEHGMKGVKQWEVADLCHHRDIDQIELDDLAKNGAKMAAKGKWWV